MVRLLLSLGNKNLKLKLFIVFTLQNKVSNQNWNNRSHFNLKMENERLIPKEHIYNFCNILIVLLYKLVKKSTK